MNQALQDVIEHRRTTNVFEPNHTISDEQIEHLVHLATRAPTSFNLQNWRFLAVRTPERKAKLRKLAYDQAKVSEAAVTFIVCGQLADYSALEGRLAPSADAGFMSPELVEVDRSFQCLIIIYGRKDFLPVEPPPQADLSFL
jgi:nitroreductase